MYNFLSNIVIFLTLTLIGCQNITINNQTEIPIEQYLSLKSIKNYLNANVSSTGFDGKPYCAYEILGAESDGTTEKIYLWVLCQEYYQENQKLKPGTSGSFPVALTVKENKNELQIISHQIPGDGSMYVKDLQKIFPEKIRAKIESESTDSHNARLQKLEKEIKNEANIAKSR